MKYDIEHPVITEMETFGFVRNREEPEEFDEDAAYEERKERELFGEE